MTGTTCASARLELTELLMLGEQLPSALRRHVERCPGCAREVQEVRAVVRVLGRAQPGPPAAAPRPHRRWPAIAAGVAAVAIAACATLLPAHVGPVQTVALSRTGTMIPQPWGTEVPIRLSGLRPGHVYRLVTEDGTGRRLDAGTIDIRAAGPVQITMVTSMSKNSIAALLVDDDTGQEVALLAVPPQLPS